MDTNARIKALIGSLFGCEPSSLTDDTGPGDIPGWDSLGHVMLIAEIQKQFGTQVPVEEAIEIESIADLAALLDRQAAS